MSVAGKKTDMAQTVDQLNVILRYETKIDKALKDIDKVKKSTTGLTSFFKDAASAATGFFAADVIQGAIRGIGQLGAKSIQLAKDYEQTTVAFETFLGSAEKAQVVLGDLEKFSLSTPFEPEQVNEAGKALLAFGVESDKLVPSLQKIGDISAGTGKDFNELAVIFGKAKTQGTLFAEDINQLTEAGVPIIQEFAKQFGVAESEVKKLGSEGKITFDNLEQAFADMTGEGGRFNDLMIRQSSTLGGLASTMNGFINSFLRQIGQFFLPALKELARIAISVFSTLTDLTGDLGENDFGLKMAAGIRAAAAGFKTFGGQIVGRIKTIIDGFRSLTSFARAAFSFLTGDRARATELFNQGKTEGQAFIDGIKESWNPVNNAREMFTAISGTYQEALAELREDQATADVASSVGEKTGGDIAGGIGKGLEKPENIEKIKQSLRRIFVDGDIISDNLEDFIEERFQKMVDQQAKIAEERAKLLKEGADLGAQYFAEADAEMERSSEELTEKIKSEIEKREELEKMNAEARKEIAEQSVGIAQELLQFNIDAVNREIEAADQKRQRLLEVAGEGNAEQLELEERRQEQLIEKREQFVQAQRQIAAAEFAANMAIAISRAAAEGGAILSPVFIATLLAAVAGGIAQVSALAQGFREGTEYVNGPGTETSDSIPAMLSRGERVVPARINKKLRGISNEELVDLVNLREKGAGGRAARASEIGVLKKELAKTRRAIEEMAVVFNVDDRGMYMGVQRVQSIEERRKKIKK